MTQITVTNFYRVPDGPFCVKRGDLACKCDLLGVDGSCRVFPSYEEPEYNTETGNYHKSKKCIKAEERPPVPKYARLIQDTMHRVEDENKSVRDITMQFFYELHRVRYGCTSNEIENMIEAAEKAISEKEEKK